MAMPDLTLRPTIIAGEKAEDDFVVIRELRAIGRIRLATERTGHNPGWDWGITVPLPIQPYGHGNAGSLEEAKTRFRQAWERFYATLEKDDIEHWHHHQDAAKERFSRPRKA